MKRTNKYLSVITLLFIFVLSAFKAYPQSDTLELSLDKAIELALQENRNIKISELEIQKSELMIKETLGGLLPKVDATGQYIRNIKKPVIFLPEGSPFGTVMEIGSDNSYNGTLSASIPVFSGPLFSSIRLARMALNLSNEAKRGTRINIAADVKKAYNNVLIASEALKVMEMSFDNAEENLEKIKHMSRQGMVAEYDLIRAQVQTGNLRPLVKQAKDNHNLALNLLKITMGLTAEQEIRVTDSLTIDKDNIMENDLPAAASDLSQNSALRQLDHQLMLTGEQVTLTRSSRYPTVAVFGNYQYQAQANDFKFDEYTWVNTSLVGLRLQVPIFNGFITKNKIAREIIGTQQVIEQKNMLSEAIKVQLKNEIYKMEQSYNRIETQQQTVSLAEKGFEIAKTCYGSGTGTLLELNDAGLALTQAKLNYLQAVYDYKIALVEYEKLMGLNY
ncbi:MAG: TolC family protein [Bacteroidota bacterium]